jgi:hypothetical protein
MKAPKIIRDTLQEKNGKWSIKRVAGISAFYVAIVYAFTPIWFTTFIIHEFVFWGFITFGASAIMGTVWNKKIDKANINENSES